MNESNQRLIWILDGDGTLPPAAELARGVGLIFGPLAEEMATMLREDRPYVLVIAKKAQALERLPELIQNCNLNFYHDVPIGHAGVKNHASWNSLLNCILSSALEKTNSNPMMRLLIDPKNSKRCLLLITWSEEYSNGGVWLGVARETILHVAQAVEEFQLDHDLKS